MNAAIQVFRKEIIDALRDRKTLLIIALSSLLSVPAMLLVFSKVISDYETRDEQRVILVSGIEAAPQLRNSLERQTYTLREAPADYAQQLREGRLSNPVLAIPADFSTKLAQGEAPVVEIVFDHNNRDARLGVGKLHKLVDGYVSEQAFLLQALRGVAPAGLQTVIVDERDLASIKTGGDFQFTAMLPFLIIIAALSGSIAAAIDTTAGERERGSLESLLMNPVARASLVLGKWGAVACTGMLPVIGSVISCLAARWLIQNETLQSLFQFGILEGILFLFLLVPFAAELAALLMALAVRCKTLKEAQASCSVVIIALSLMPIATVFSPTGDPKWTLWVPGLGQQTLMNHVLKGESLTTVDVLIPVLVSLTLTAVCLIYVARYLKTAATS